MLYSREYQLMIANLIANNNIRRVILEIKTTDAY